MHKRFNLFGPSSGGEGGETNMILLFHIIIIITFDAKGPTLLTY